MSDEVVIDALKTTVYELSCRVLERDDRIRELEHQNARLRDWIRDSAELFKSDVAEASFCDSEERARMLVRLKDLEAHDRRRFEKAGCDTAHR